VESDYAKTPAAALDLIEAAEARHLAWGLLDESWEHGTLLAHLSEYWAGDDPEACLKTLLAENSLLKVPKSWPQRYRSRMAESVRLFCRLRQLFPNKPWQSGAALVSDYRFLRRPRAFPERTVSADDVVEALQDRQVTPAVVAEVRRIIGSRKLSRFQQDSTHAVFAALRETNDQAVVVGAGTGSGKTLAFYLPTLASIAASIDNGPRAIAIYPRNELLKDQLANALGETRALRTAGGRQLTIGAYFGPTPTEPAWSLDDSTGWRRRGTGWLCPFLTCPAPTRDRERCGGGLVWDKPSRVPSQRQWGKLACVLCGSEVTSDEVRLTRNAMRDAPPDILFTTTQMLRRRREGGASPQADPARRGAHLRRDQWRAGRLLATPLAEVDERADHLGGTERDAGERRIVLR
jgi:hypothetical protein